MYCESFCTDDSNPINMDWKPLDITAADDRKAVALALYLSGYEVRQRKRKDGNKTIVFIEYR